MQKLRMLLLGLGFFWIFAWTVFGSIIGAKLNNLVATNVDPNWRLSWQFSVLKGAHSHMNLMSITLILLALSMNSLRSHISDKKIIIVLLANVISIPIFGAGLIFEAFSPPSNGMISWVSCITAFGGIIYMLSIASWSAFFLASAFWKNKE